MVDKDLELNPTDPVSPTGSHILTLHNLVERLRVLTTHGAIQGEQNARLFQAMFTQILKDIEAKRIESERQVQLLRDQLSKEESKVQQARIMRTVVYNVVNKFAMSLEADLEEDERIRKAEEEADREEAEEQASKKTTRKKASRKKPVSDSE